jgi:hypothetical protein
MDMSDFGASPIGYHPVPDNEVERRLNYYGKKHILLISVGSISLLTVTVISSLIVFNTFYHQKQPTTMTKEITVLTTVSTRTTEGEIMNLLNSSIQSS